MKSENGKFTINFPSLDRFYKECDEFEPTGNREMYNEIRLEEKKSFRGLSIKKIEESKYAYKEGLDKLKAIEKDINLGGTKNKYRWDEFDGDDMDYDRFLENLNCLKKRVKIAGGRSGKIINIHVGICENCNISVQQMLIKSYTVMRLIDYLENMNYRVGVLLYGDIYSLGRYKGKLVESLHFEICIKKPEEPLIKPLILTTISPWMFRYHVFKLLTAKFDCNWSLGCSKKVDYEDTNTDVYIGTGSCLNEESSEDKIKDLAKKFSFNE